MPTPGFDINEVKRRMQGATQSLKHELGGLRTGRAAASMLEPVQVEAYGSHMPLNQLATISVPEPRMLSVQVWDKSIAVPVTTLDALIETHGVPAFVKIDVEGFEAEALAGLTQPVEVLSFEFTTIQRNVAQACIARCQALGFQRYNAAVGESQELGDWRSAEAIARWLLELPHAANSGDIYARMA